MSRRPTVAGRLAPFAIGSVGLAGVLAWGAAIGGFTTSMTVMAGLGAALMVTGALFQEGGRLRFSLLSFAYSTFVLLSLAMVYLIAANRSFRVDLTADRIHTLSPQTRGFLESLETDVQVAAFAPPADQGDMARFLSMYASISPHVRFDVHDPDADLAEARRFGDDVVAGDVFVTSFEGAKQLRRTRVKLPRGYLRRELEFSNALVKAVRGREERIYFLRGHGEKSMEPQQLRRRDQDETLTKVAKFLSERTMECAPLNLLEAGRIPPDAGLVIIAGPTVDLFDAERDMLVDYLSAGGGLVAFVDPVFTSDGARTPNLDKVLARAGVEALNEFVVDPQAQASGLGHLAPMVAKARDHPIIGGIGNRFQMFMDRARPLVATPDPDRTLEVTPLFLTSDKCWSEDVFKIASTQKATQPDDPGRIHEQVLATASTFPTPRGERGELAHVVVVGDSDIFANFLLPDSAELFLLQAANWATEQGDQLAVPPRVVTRTPVLLTQGRLYTLAGAFLLLGLGVLAGGTAYTVARRRLR